MKREEKQKHIQEFIGRYLERLEALDDGAPEEQQLSLIAHSPESPVSCALAPMLDRLQAAGIGIRIIFGTVKTPGSLSPWLDARCEVRRVVDQRLLDAHEQLVLGSRMVWLGDAMRREPDKSDTHQSFRPDEVETATRGRRAFDRLSRAIPPLPLKRAIASLAAVGRTEPNLRPVSSDALARTVDMALIAKLVMIPTRH